MKTILLMCTFIVSQSIFASEDLGPSAFRDLKKDYTIYEMKELEKVGFEKMDLLRITPLNSARFSAWNSKLPEGTTWRSLEDLQDRFEEIRDERFLTLPDEPHFPRRIPWLYPKDGCYARAALFNKIAFRKFIPVPGKVFAFGNLRVKTKNVARGVVGWWYHVAPIVQVKDTKYVLDPSIEASRPLPLKEWLSRMGDPTKMKVAFCKSGTYSPSDSCEKETDGLELHAQAVERVFLQLEKKELRRLKRNHELELGEEPPWGKK